MVSVGSLFDALLRESRHIAAASLAGVTLGVVDLALADRASPAGVIATLAAFAAAGTAGGLALLVVSWPLRWAPPARRFSRRRLLLALVSGAIAFGAARYALHAPLVAGGSSAGRFHALLGGVSALAVAVAYVALPAVARRRRSRASVWLAFTFALAGSALTAVDRLVLVSLYERAHAVVEALGFAAFTAAYAASLDGSWRAVRRLAPALAFAMLGWLTVFASSPPTRSRLEAALPSRPEGKRGHLGRLVRRVRAFEHVAEGGHPALPPGVHHLATRYELHDTRLDEDWSAPVSRAAVRHKAADAQPWNVVVFFVDTLRADVAADDATMPETAAWMRDNVSFSRAYAPASSTLPSLAPLLGCRYDTKPTEAPALLRAANDRGLRSALFIPRVVADYHRAFFPAFRFDHEVVAEHGADESPLTGETLVDDALAWLQRSGSSPFFLWLYDFDVHEWHRAPESALATISTEARLAQAEGLLPWRYRAAARAVDRSFARLRRGLAELGLLERTVVVFLADHGEGLGEHGQWAHSTYLWETLVRVPLAIQAQGLAPRKVDTPVSLVDLPTTLSRFIGPVVDEERCHGEDLLAEVDAPRRLPILLAAMFEGSLVRVGLLESAQHKLIVDLRDGDARLYDLATDEHRVAHASTEGARLLNRLVRSPLYPRAEP